MTNKKLSDLNDHLFAQLDRLGDANLSGDKLSVEIERSKSICGVATAIVSNATLALKAAELAADYGLKTSSPFAMLENKNDEKS